MVDPLLPRQRAQGAAGLQSFEECNRGSLMDEKLWAGVELKLLYAEFHFDMMGRAIQPPKQNSINVALQASRPRYDRAFLGEV
jgi:hypothetical protein